MKSICDLPREILLRIFQYYLETEKSKDFMKNIYNVCKSWRSLCFDPSLWTTYDGSSPFKTMMKLCNKKSFGSTRDFTFSANKLHSLELAAVLLSKLKNVNSIDFSNLKKVTRNMCLGVRRHCSNLRKIQFGKSGDVNGVRKQLRHKYLFKIFSVRGSNMLSINLSYCDVDDLTTTIKSIADCCHKLEELYLIHASLESTLFPNKHVQAKCPDLKVLRLDSYCDLPNERITEGFPNLEIFSFYDRHKRYFYNEKLNCILFNSLCLKELSLNGCYISTSFLCSLPATDLQILQIPNCRTNKNGNFPAVMKKWCHSLKRVDVSKFSNRYFNEAVIDLITTPALSQLKEIHLMFSPVNNHVVSEVLKKCKMLQELNLKSCRNVDRRMKRCFSVKTGNIHVLKEIVKSLNYA